MPTPQPNEEIYIGLDIGSSKVCCIVGLHEEGMGMPSIIGVGTAPTTGVRKGSVVDVEETVSSITAAVDEAERISGVPIDRATISIDGAHISSLNSKGVIAVGRADQEITVEDLRRAEEAATAVHLPPNREILQIFPRTYTVDDQAAIEDPVGMKGVRLEVETHIIIGATPNLKNLHRAVYQAGIDIEGQVLVPLAAARAVLTKQQRELGTVLIDIGAGSTGVAVFEEGDVLYSNILPVGSGHITNDIAIGLKTSIEMAEQIKLKYVKAHLDRRNINEKIADPELLGDKVISGRELHRIASARLEEIFELIRAELKKIGRDKMLPAGAIMTGGGAQLKGIEEAAKDLLGLPAQVARPEGYTGMADKIASPAYATAVGLMLENTGHLKNADRANVKLGKTVERIKKTFKNLLP